MNKTITVHVRYKSLYDSMPSPTKQQNQMTTFCVCEERERGRLIFHIFHLELNGAIAFFNPEHGFKAKGVLNSSGQLQISLVKYRCDFWFHFFLTFTSELLCSSVRPPFVSCALEKEACLPAPY